MCQSHAIDEFEEFFECIEGDIEIEGEVGSRLGKPVLVTPSLSRDDHQPTDVRVSQDAGLPSVARACML